MHARIPVQSFNFFYFLFSFLFFLFKSVVNLGWAAGGGVKRVLQEGLPLLSVQNTENFASQHPPQTKFLHPLPSQSKKKPLFPPRLFELLEHEDEDLQQLATDTKLLIQRITNEQLDTYMM